MFLISVPVSAGDVPDHLHLLLCSRIKVVEKLTVHKSKPSKIGTQFARIRRAIVGLYKHSGRIHCCHEAWRGEGLETAACLVSCVATRAVGETDR